MTVSLGTETFRQPFNKGRQGNVGQVGGEPAGLKAGGIQQVLDHGGEMVGLLLDHGQAVLDDGLIPFGVLTPQGGNVSLDERNRSLKLVADDGNESVLYLFSIAKLGDVTHGGDNVAQRPIGCEQRGVGDPDRQGRWFRALEIAFYVKIGIGS
jgi:hypothetical protein